MGIHLSALLLHLSIAFENVVASVSHIGRLRCICQLHVPWTIALEVFQLKLCVTLVKMLVSLQCVAFQLLEFHQSNRQLCMHLHCHISFNTAKQWPCVCAFVLFRFSLAEKFQLTQFLSMQQLWVFFFQPSFLRHGCNGWTTTQKEKRGHQSKTCCIGEGQWDAWSQLQGDFRASQLFLV